MAVAPPPRDAGRVIVYQTGGAYVERLAVGPAEVRVRKEKLPDLVRSLSVVDATSGEALPTAVPSEASDGTLAFHVGVGGRPVRLAYLTESPPWKSSYRLVLLPSGKIEVQGWATVENTSVEDWANVRVGVGARSTMGEDEAHFEPARATTVPRGSSAMVPLFHAETDGESVYVLDGAEPLRAVRFRNPMTSALEAGSVFLVGDGRWIGDGNVVRVGRGSIAFVTFATERAITAERRAAQRSEVAQVDRVANGIARFERRDVRSTTLHLKNAKGERAVVLVKHVVTPGFKLFRFPDDRSPAPGATDASDHLADTSYFRILLEPNAGANVVIEEARTATASADLRTREGRALVAPKLDETRRTRLAPLLAMEAEVTKLEGEARAEEQRSQAAETRIAELRRQLAALEGVRDAKGLKADLQKRIRALEADVKKAVAEVDRIQHRLAIANVELETAAADITF